MLTRRRLLALTSALAAELAGASRVLGFEDAVGTKITLSHPPRRIVAINPSMVESVVAIGGADRLVGIGGKVAYPQDVLRLPSVGGALGISLEAVLALEPDLVIMALGAEGSAQIVSPLREMGCAVFLATYSDFASILRYIRLLGNVSGLREGAERLTAGMEQTVASVSRSVRGLNTPKVYFETGAAGTGAFQTVRSGHYADDAIRLAGGRNAFNLAGPPQVTLEGIDSVDPDRIIVLASDPALTAEAVAARPGWQALRAVRERRITILPRGFMLIPGPRQAEAITILARAIHPGALG